MLIVNGLYLIASLPTIRMTASARGISHLHCISMNLREVLLKIIRMVWGGTTHKDGATVGKEDFFLFFF